MTARSKGDVPSDPQSSFETRAQRFDFASKALIALLTGVVAIGGSILKIGQDQINTELAAAKNQREAIAQKLNQEIDLRKAERDDAQQRTAIMLRIFEKAESTIDNAKDSAKDRAIRERKINATVLLINGLTPYVRDVAFVNGIVGVLGEMSTDPATKAKIQRLIEFDSDTAVYQHEPTPAGSAEGKPPQKTSGLMDVLITSAFAQSSKPDLRRFRVDIFFCSTAGDAKGTEARRNAAKAIFDKIVATGTAGPIRVRDMPEIVNTRPGYGVTANEVRYDPQDPAEVDVTHAIVALLNPPSSGLQPFVVRAVAAQPTPGYVSIFVCAR